MSANHPAESEMPPRVEGITTRSSPFSVKDTLERLQQAVRKRGLTLFAQIDHSEEAQRVGLTMREAHVLIFGHPKAGTPLMIASPLLALDLPLKVLVWQSDDGQVWASHTSVAYLANRYSIPPALTGNIAGIDDLVIDALGT